MFFSFFEVLSNFLICGKMDTDFGFIFALVFFIVFAILLISLLLVAFIPKKTIKRKKHIVLPTVVSVDKDSKTIYDMQNKKIDIYKNDTKI